MIEAVFLGTFTWAKLNLADMSRTGLNAEIRDTKEGTVYPAPIAEFPVLTGFGAGYPDYPWFFGTDGAYTTFGLAVTGQCDAARNHLNLVRSISQNGSQYTTTLSAPTEYKVQLGYVIPAGTKPTSVTLGRTAVKYQTIATLRGNEVVVETPSGPNLSLVINTQ